MWLYILLTYFLHQFYNNFPKFSMKLVLIFEQLISNIYRPLCCRAEQFNLLPPVCAVTIYNTAMCEQGVRHYPCLPSFFEVRS